MKFNPYRPVGFESRKAYARRCFDGFWERWVCGPDVVDIGYRGGIADAMPLVDSAIGIETDTVGYDGFHLPIDDGWADAVHASHVLEHVAEPERYLAEWFRIVKLGGTLILMVPHAFLYERRITVPPSRWSPEHLRSYTPATLLAEVERALEPNTYRVRHLSDDDTGYDYALPIDVHPVGVLEIALVLEKINPPSWRIEA